MFGVYLHGGSMNRKSSSDKKAAGRLDAHKGGTQALRANGPNPMGQRGEADRRSRVLQEAHYPVLLFFRGRSMCRVHPSWRKCETRT